MRRKDTPFCKIFKPPIYSSRDFLRKIVRGIFIYAAMLADLFFLPAGYGHYEENTEESTTRSGWEYIFRSVLRTNPITQTPVFSAMVVASVVVAPRETMIGMFATRHLRTISDDMRPEQIANVSERSIPFRRPYQSPGQGHCVFRYPQNG